MAGLDPAIHDIADNLYLDGRLKGGHDFCLSLEPSFLRLRTLTK